MVRQPELVGRTVPCPKCKNAIHVVRPGEVAWNPGTVGTTQAPAGTDPKKTPVQPQPPRRPASTVNSEAITKADPGDWNLEELETALASQAPTTNEAGEEVFFREVGNEPATARRKESEPFSIQPLDPTESAKSTTPATWQSPQAKARRQLLTLFVVGLSGCLLAGLAFIGFLNFYGKPNRDKQQANPVVEPQPVEPIKPVEQGDPKKPAELIAEAESNGQLGQVAPVADPSGLPPENTQAAAVEPANEQPLNMEPDNTKNEPSQNTQVIDAMPNKPAEASDSPADQAIDEDLPPIFKDFLPIFDRSSQPGWSDLGKIGDKTIDQELSIENADVIFSQEYYPQPIALPGWAERAQRKLGRIRTKPMSLPRFVQWINRVSGHAISIDWFLFNLSDIPLDQPYAFESEGTTVGGILDEFKTKIGAEVDVDAKGFLVLRPSAEKLSTKLKPDGSTELGPMSKGLPEGQDQAILKLVLEMLQVNGCEYRDGKLLWGAETNAYQQAQVLAALASIRERLGTANPGAEGAENVFDFNRPEAWVRLYRKSQSKLGKEEIQYEERPIVDIMTRAAQSSQVEMLLDWPSVWSHGLHPNRMGLSVLRGRTLLEVSNRFLEDHSLELVPLDSKTWMLTTESQRRSMIRLVAVRTDRGVSLEDMRVSIRGVVPRGNNGKSLFRSMPLPGVEGLVLLRICPPNSSLMADQDLLQALGQTP
ncbi:MAG: hypothetical protein ACKO3V_17525 [Pirellula sp.]